MVPCKRTKDDRVDVFQERVRLLLKAQTVRVKCIYVCADV